MIQFFSARSGISHSNYVFQYFTLEITVVCVVLRSPYFNMPTLIDWQSWCRHQEGGMLTLCFTADTLSSCHSYTSSHYTQNALPCNGCMILHSSSLFELAFIPAAQLDTSGADDHHAGRTPSLIGTCRMFVNMSAENLGIPWPSVLLRLPLWVEVAAQSQMGS